ncbi:MAG: hypothetical protein O3B64_00565 [bacterium]|nr:hypothetical protein [bacterium]MDA1024691.1 hypothetical protein [bacterium]
MSPRIKQLLQITVFLFVAFLMGLGLYFLFFRSGPQLNPSPDLPAEGATNTSPNLPSSNSGTPVTGIDTDEEIEQAPDASQVADGGDVLTVQLTSSDIIAPTTVVSGSVRYYDPADGRFYEIDRNGNVTLIASRAFQGAESISLNNGGDSAAIEFPDGSNVLYNLNTNEQTSLPDHWEDFGFSGEGDELASKAIGLDPNNRTLVATSTDGSRTRTIAPLGTNSDKVTINWSPNNTIVGFSQTGSAQTGFGREQIFLIDENGNEEGALVVEGGSFSARWAPSGNYILYSVAETNNDYRASLWYTRGSGDVGSERRRINLETWVEKCTFASESVVYCAVPRNGQAYSGFDPEDVFSPDDVYEINVKTGATRMIGSPVLDLRLFNLSVSADGRDLYFTDQAGRLNLMRLR